jgi:hypothetical protein
VMRMKVGVSRKEATGEEGSVGATCEIEVEIPGNATDEEVLRIRNRWLGFCEATVEEELGRLLNGHSESPSPRPPAPAARPTVASTPAARPDPRAQPPARRDRDDDHRDEFEEPHAPNDGRQLLGWAAKQVPDAKGLVISFGRKRGYPPKIVDWDDEQVLAAYRFAKRQQGR